MSGGRPPSKKFYTTVSYNDKEYIVGKVQYRDEFQYFVVDKDDEEKISNQSWHVCSKTYIGHDYRHTDNKIKVLYLHNHIMNREHFQGKGQTETVDHINRNGFDNRKENLRILTQSAQNLNQRKKPRVIELPDDSDISINDIPKHIWYMKANGGHGDRFVIEFKTKNFEWKSTSSKKVSLSDKLTEAKNKLEELYIKYPELSPDYEKDLRESLKESFDNIVKLAIISFSN